MFLSRRNITRLIVLVAIIWYRNGTVIKNCLLNHSPFTTGYVAGGDYATQCSTVRPEGTTQAESLSSCEDATFWELRDAAGKTVERAVIATCDPGRKAWNTVMGPLRDPAPRGGLWLYAPRADGPTTAGGRAPVLKLRANEAHRVALAGYPEGHDFHPLGLAVWPSHSGNASNLYVVNHARKRTVIEHFILDPAHPTEARHVRTISSRYFVSPNALALTSPDAFYVSNDHLITRRWPLIGRILPLVESLLALPLGFVSHVTLAPPGAPRAIASHTFAKLFFPFPNGVAVNPAGDRLAVSSSSLAQVSIFARDPATDALNTLLSVIQMPFTPDNLHYSYSRTSRLEEIIVGGHPNFPDLVAVAAGKPRASAASWVAAIVPKVDRDAKPEAIFDTDAPVSTSSKLPTDGTRWTLKTLFQSNGVESEGGFGSSTTGLRDPDTGNLFVTGLYAEGGMLVCKPRPLA